jgi:acetate kinase
MVALKDGIPQDTTMALTPTGGLMMGTRSGDLDPGVLFFLMRKSSRNEQDSLLQTEKLLNYKSGLLGVSGISQNMKELLKEEANSVAAKEAIALFCYCARKFIGSLSAVLGGLDTLVFTGGMGEKSAEIRSRICADLSFLNIHLESTKNDSNASIISPEGISRTDINHEQRYCTIRVQHTDENLTMAKHAVTLLSRGVSHESK